jgi:hypothetical protein
MVAWVSTSRVGKLRVRIGPAMEEIAARAYQTQKLKVVLDVSAAVSLVEELLNFQVKITASANETFGTWREGRHDDLVLAVAVAAWAGESMPMGRYEIWC